MVTSKAQIKATLKYKNAHYKRIPLDVNTEFYERLKAAAAASGESVNGYIKAAVLARMENEKAAADPE